MCKEFSGREQDEIFREWLCDNKAGFYLNKKDKDSWMLHKKGCHHLGTGEGMITTTKPKAAANNIQSLFDWAKSKNCEIIPCSVPECTDAYINKK